MRIMACKSFLLLNIMFLTRIHAQPIIQNLRMPDMGMASAPSPNPGMASAPSPECPAPSPAAGPSSSSFDLGLALPPTLAPLNLNCSSCPIDPFGLAACGMLISGDIKRDTIGLCCTTLSSLSKEDASACLCNAIQIKAVKIGYFDVTEAMNKALAVCSPEPSNPGMATAPAPSSADPGITLLPSSAFEMSLSLAESVEPPKLNCSSCPIDPFGLAACGILIAGKIMPDTIGLCCTTLSSLSKEDASACVCNAIEVKAVKFGDFDVTDAINKVLAACSKL